MDQADWVNVVQTLWLVGLTFWVTRPNQKYVGDAGPIGPEGPPGPAGAMGAPGSDHTKDIEDIGRRLFVLENERDGRTVVFGDSHLAAPVDLPVEGVKTTTVSSAEIKYLSIDSEPNSFGGTIKLVGDDKHE